eukprot:6554269-Pyramimonas_sp.AAC.1
MSAYPTESFAQLFEGVIGSRDNVVSPAFSHDFLIHRAYRWELPQRKSIPDHTRSPAGVGRISWVVQLIHGRVSPRRSLCR